MEYLKTDRAHFSKVLKVTGLQYLYNISKKEVRDGFHFLPADKHESFYKLALSFITEVTRHVQSTQKKEEVGYIYFWYTFKKKVL